MNAQSGTKWAKKRKTIGIVAGVLLAMLGGIAYGLSAAEPPGLVLFIGRFHPLVVHLPIGMLVIALLMEGAAHCEGMERLREANFFVLLCAAISAAFAVVAGLFLAREGGYNEATLFWHRWLGIGVAVGSSAAAGLEVLSRRPRGVAWRRAYQSVLVGTAGLLMITGHLGGTLTHGATYLTRHMPAPLANLTGWDASGAAGAARFVDIDSAYVYKDLVEPILQQRCASCHSANKTKGGLRLDTPEHLLEGGDSGAVVEAGKPEESELLRRLILPLYDEERMPPDGEDPLKVGETELIRWWIAEGARLDQQVAEAETQPLPVQTILVRLSPPPQEVKTGLYALDADPADPSVVAEIERKTELAIRPVGDDLPFLQVSASGAEITDEEVRTLRTVGEQVAWLDLRETKITDAAMETIGELPNLTRLYLQNTGVGDAGLEHLVGLEHLAYVNMYGTDVSNRGLELLAALEGLETVYLWQTDVSPEAAKDFERRRPEVNVNMGMSLLPPDSTIQAASSTNNNADSE